MHAATPWICDATMCNVFFVFSYFLEITWRGLERGKSHYT